MNYPPKTPLEQQAMTFSAIMKAIQGHLTADNVLPVADKVWRWTVVTITDALISPTTEVQDQKEAPQEDFPPTKEAHKITDKQQKRLFAIAKRVGMSNDRLKAFLKEGYGMESTKDIPWKQYDEICTAIETGDLPFLSDPRMNRKCTPVRVPPVSKSGKRCCMTDGILLDQNDQALMDYLLRGMRRFKNHVHTQNADEPWGRIFGMRLFEPNCPMSLPRSG